jgi:hypothetical protein
MSVVEVEAEGKVEAVLLTESDLEVVCDVVGVFEVGRREEEGLDDPADICVDVFEVVELKGSEVAVATEDGETKTDVVSGSEFEEPALCERTGHICSQESTSSLPGTSEQSLRVSPRTMKPLHVAFFSWMSENRTDAALLLTDRA